MPAFWGYPLPPHDYPYYWFILDPNSKQDKVKCTNLKNLPKLPILAFWKNLNAWHTFWSCLIRCLNMKWIWQVLWKIQRGHDSVHRRTDRQMDRRTDGQRDTSIPPFNFVEQGYNKTCIEVIQDVKKTRTTRMPAFWDTPWLPILVIHIRFQVKRKQSQSCKFEKNCQKFKF